LYIGLAISVLADISCCQLLNIGISAKLNISVALVAREDGIHDHLQAHENPPARLMEQGISQCW